MSDWIVEAAMNIYTFLLPFSWVAFAIAVFVFLPLAAWRKTRGAAGLGFVVVSYIFGATTWFLGAAVTFGSFGWIGLIIGLFIFGIGVVPFGIIGAFFKLGINELGVSLCVMLVITLAARFAGAACVAAADRNAAKLRLKRTPPPQAQTSDADLVGAFGQLMQQYPTALLDTARLPAPKQKMKAVIKEVWRQEPKLRGVLTQAYLHLSQFQDGIGDAVLDCKISEAGAAAAASHDLDALKLEAIEMSGPKGESFRQWITWSKVSTAEMEILAQEWKGFVQSNA